jgi:pectate lyase
VILAKGEYTISNPTDQLRISGLGHPSNRLSIEGQEGFGTILRVVPNASSASVTSLVIDNSRNIVLRNMHFRAAASVNLYYFLKVADSSNITMAGVSAIDAKDIKYGVFGPSESTNIIFRENEIQRTGTTDGHHAIYGFNTVSGLTVENNVFEDITGSHIRCRSKCQTITINNNEFMATGGSWSSNTAYKWPFFVELAVYNDCLWNGSNPDQQEWFIGGVVASGNSFTYAGSPTGTRNVPFQIGASGYEPWDGTAFRKHLISKAEASVLLNGTCDQKRAFINNKFSIDLGTEFSVLNNRFSGQRRLAQLGSYARYGAADHYPGSDYEGGNKSFDLSSCLR